MQCCYSYYCSSYFRCEPFDTYPRTYDLLHAAGLFSREEKRLDHLFCCISHSIACFRSFLFSKRKFKYRIELYHNLFHLLLVRLRHLDVCIADMSHSCRQVQHSVHSPGNGSHSAARRLGASAGVEGNGTSGPSPGQISSLADENLRDREWTVR